jgi:Ca-activated chloride channel family protein
MFHFADPWYLLALLVVPFMIWRYLKDRGITGAKLKYSDIRLLRNLGQTLKQRLQHLLFAARVLAVILFIIALARPQSGSKEQKVSTEGVDIVLAMDVSSSMLAEDFKPNNRLQAAKIVAEEFIKGRVNDRIGMVVFAGESFTQCPLTLDYGVLLTLLKEVKIADKDWDGTAIGMGIANAVNRLRDSKAKSKIIILLTDGVNNRGQIDPITAARIAQALKIRIYTIGAGTQGTAMYPVDDPLFGRRYVPREVKIDEKVLRKIAQITGGRYYRATNTEKLRKIYKEIGEMEKTKIEVSEYTRYTELFSYFLAAGLLLLLLEAVLRNTYFRTIP